MPYPASSPGFRFIHLALLLLAILPGKADALPMAPQQLDLAEAPAQGKPSAIQQYDLGRQAVRRKDYVAAVEAFRRSQELDPQLPHPLLGQADLAMKQGKSAEAETWLRKALGTAPNNAMVHTAWGRYLAMSNRSGEAEKAYLRAIELAPKAFLPRMDLGDLYLNRLQQPEQAIQHYKVAKAIRPEHAGVYYALGLAHSALGQAGIAVLALERSAQLDPRTPLPLHALGRLYMAGGKLDQALAALNRAGRVKPDYLIAFLDRGDVYMLQGKPQQAIGEYQKVLKVAPRYAYAYLKLGMTEQGQGQWGRAEAAYRQAIQHDPDLALAYNNLAWLAAERKISASEAPDWAKKATSLKPDNAQFLDTLGWLYRSQGDLAKASATLEKAANMKPPQPEIMLHLAQVHLEQGKRKQARELVDKTLRIKPGLTEALNLRKQIDAAEQ